MDPELIKYLLKTKGAALADIARALDLDRSIVSNVIHGRVISWKVAHRISVLIDVPVSKMWQGKYPQLEVGELRRAA